MTKMLILMISSLILIGTVYAYSPAHIKNLSIELHAQGGSAVWDDIMAQGSGMKLHVPGKRATIDRQQHVLSYQAADFNVEYELPLMLQGLQTLSLSQLQMIAQEKSLSINFPEFRWDTTEGDGLITQFLLTSQFNPTEVVPESSTQAMLLKSDWSIKGVKLPSGLSFPIPGKAKPIEMRELQNAKAQIRAQILTSSAQIPGLIPVPVELKAKVTPLPQDKGVSVDIQSFQIANIELKLVLLSQLKKWETPQFKVNGSVITWSKAISP